jgi:hypothetical protein
VALSPTSSRGTSGAAASLTLLSTTTLAGAGTIDVTGISQLYNDLVLMAIIRGAGTNTVDNLLLKFNGDSVNTNYDSSYVYGNNGVIATAGQNNPEIAHEVPDSSATAGRFGFIEIVIPGYTSTTWAKVATAKWGVEATVVGNIRAGTQTLIWKNTAAINEVTLSCLNVANLGIGSTLRIYGRL